MNSWPYTPIPMQYKCSICGRLVETEFAFDQSGRKFYYPASLYWNPAKREIYCNPECSLKGHNQ